MLELNSEKLVIRVFEGAEYSGDVHFGQFEGQIGQISDFSKVRFIITSPTYVGHISHGHPDLVYDQWSVW